MGRPDRSAAPKGGLTCSCSQYLAIGCPLELVQVRHRALGMGCGLHDRPLVILQDLNPAADIAGVVGSGFQGKAKVGCEKCRAQLGNQFLARVPFVTPCFTTKRTIKAGWTCNGFAPVT